MTKIKHIIILLLLITSFISKAQDMHFTQFYATSMYLNPALTGANVCSRVSMAYRNQWPGVSKTYSSYLFSYDHYLPQNNLGVGLMIANDVAGTGNLKTTMIYPTLAYELTLNRSYSLRFGMQPGVIIKSINGNGLVFGDQIARGGVKGASSVATVEAPFISKSMFDIGAGTVFYSSDAWIGVAFKHLTRPNESLMDLESRMPLYYNIHGGYKHIFSGDGKPSNSTQKITAAFNYRGQQDFDQFDVGFYFTQSVINMGMWYRGLPGVKAYKPGYANNDALSFILGVETARFNIGYSYDITISKLAGVTNGAHEITTSFQLCAVKAKKKKIRLISCPKF